MLVGNINRSGSDILNEHSLLLVGHPGHELLLYGWIAQTRPVVCVLTDGSGMAGTPRIAQSEAVLKGLSAEIGPISGEYSDREFYRHILQCDHAFLPRCATDSQTASSQTTSPPSSVMRSRVIRRSMTSARLWRAPR